MSINKKCPKCGGAHVQLSNVKSKHGCFWFLLFGIWFVIHTILKGVIGLLVFLFYDSYMSIIHKARGKGHIWQCAKWFSRKKRYYYCHDCGYNFMV